MSQVKKSLANHNENSQSNNFYKWFTQDNLLNTCQSQWK